MNYIKFILKNFYNSEIKIKKKTLFFLFGVVNVFLTNLIIQILLIFLNTLYATFIGQLFNFLFGFYFYGKNVFNVKSLNKYHFKKYFLLNIFLWNLNWITISYFSFSFGVSKNIIAFFVIAPIALFSYIIQKYIVFNR